MSEWPTTLNVMMYYYDFYICHFIEYVDGEGDDEDDIVSKLYGSAQRELIMER